MIILTETGCAVIASVLQNTPMHLAWGTGDSAWGASDIERNTLLSLTDVTAEIARRSVMITGFAEPSTNGTIEFDNQKYNVTTTPTRYLYLKCVFEADEDASAEIRELGLFVDCVTDTSLPAGQQYFTPAQVTEKGRLFAAVRLADPIQRRADTKQAFEFVIPVVQ